MTESFQDASDVAAVPETKPVRGPGLVSNAAWSIARYAVNWVILLALPPLLISKLGSEVYAIWLLLLQISTYYTLIDTQLQTAVARFVARAAVSPSPNALPRMLASVAVFLMIWAAIILIPGMAAVWGLGWLFPNIPPERLGDAKLGAFIIVVALVVAQPFTTVVGMFLGLQRNRAVTIAIALSRFVGAALMVSYARFGDSLTLLSAAYAGGILLAPVIIGIMWRRALPDIVIPLRAASTTQVWDVAKFSLATIVFAVSFILLNGLALPVISHYDFGSVTSYSLAQTYGNMLMIPQSAIIAVMLPRLAEQSVTHDAAAMGKSLIRFARLSSLTLTVIAAGLIVIAPLFLQVWVGQALAIPTSLPAVLQVLAQFVFLTSYPYRTAVLGTGQQMRTMPALMVEGFASVLLSIVFVQFWGAPGVAAAMLVAALAGVVTHWLVSMPRTDTIRFRRRDYALHGFVYPILTLAPALVLALVFWGREAPPLVWMALAAVGCVAGVAISVCLNLTRDERRTAVAMIRLRLSGRVPGRKGA